MKERDGIAAGFSAAAQIHHNHRKGRGAVKQPHTQGGQNKGVAPQKSTPTALSLRVAQIRGCGDIALQSAVFVVDIYGMIE
jgi:hypothetical protein